MGPLKHFLNIVTHGQHIYIFSNQKSREFIVKNCLINDRESKWKVTKKYLLRKTFATGQHRYP